MANCVLKATGISKAFGGVRALDQAELTVNAGEVVCLAGENGCGKSTLIKIISVTIRRIPEPLNSTARATTGSPRANRCARACR